LAKKEGTSTELVQWIITWCLSPILRPSTSWSCRTMDTLPMCCMICLFTSHFQLTLITNYIPLCHRKWRKNVWPIS